MKRKFLRKEPPQRITASRLLPRKPIRILTNLKKTQMKTLILKKPNLQRPMALKPKPKQTVMKTKTKSPQKKSPTVTKKNPRKKLKKKNPNQLPQQDKNVKTPPRLQKLPPNVLNPIPAQ